VTTAPLERATESAGPALEPVAAAAQAPAAADWSAKVRLGGLHRFAFAITLLNVLGHFWLGFETSWAHPLAALATGYSLELLLEWVDARSNARPLRFLGGGVMGFVNFFLSAHISALAVSMLLYPNQRLLPVVFATAVAIGGKAIFRITVDGRSRHFMNPSNLGIATTLILFPWVGIAPPYQFTESLLGVGNWILPAIIICSGTLINVKYTSRLVLLSAWLGGFVVQALLRHLLLGNALLPSLSPMTGLAFLLFTFYMVTDPPTTPSSKKGQLAFGLSVAGTYGLLMAFHIVFGLFFSLVIVCGVRGTWIWLHTLQSQRQPSAQPATVASAAGGGAS